MLFYQALRDTERLKLERLKFDQDTREVHIKKYKQYGMKQQFEHNPQCSVTRRMNGAWREQPGVRS